MQETVLVSGAGGFIGKYVVDKLCRMGYAVTALVHNHIPAILFYTFSNYIPGL